MPMTDHKQPVDLSKRRWFNLAKRQQLDAKPVRANHARPPTAINEDLFLRACNGCGRCAESCPQQLIVMGPDQRPSLDLSCASCDLCKQCQKVCPTVALSATQAFTGLSATISEVCDNRYTACTNCKDACSYQALTWQEDSKPLINKDKCIGCGECVSACYIQAIYLR